ncbi:MAG: transposase, partial [Candidatus Dormibacteraeota bacterium]|nr:transposase [Candidatus Dormibacteraeota bacterium]
NFRDHYNQQRPHRALGGQTPLVAFNARVKATPALPPAPTHYRVRQDQVDDHGSVTLRYLQRRVDPPPDARPRPRPLRPRWTLAGPQCLATGVRYVLRQDIGRGGGI